MTAERSSHVLCEVIASMHYCVSYLNICYEL
jgi:hypothetical protein